MKKLSLLIVLMLTFSVANLFAEPDNWDWNFGAGVAYPLTALEATSFNEPLISANIELLWKPISALGFGVGTVGQFDAFDNSGQKIYAVGVVQFFDFFGRFGINTSLEKYMEVSLKPIEIGGENSLALEAYVSKILVNPYSEDFFTNINAGVRLSLTL